MGNLQSAIDELDTEDLHPAGPVAVAEGLVDQFRQIERLQADALRRLAFVDASGAWADDGSPSTQAWLRRRCRMAPGPPPSGCGWRAASRSSPRRGTPSAPVTSAMRTCG